MKQTILAGLLLLPAAFASAAPSVSSLSGTVAEDQTITITGSGFGTNALKTEWLGGPNGTIEKSASGVPFLSTPHAGWSEDSSLDDSYVDTRRAYSGTKSIVFDPLLARYHDGRFGLIYDTGNNFTELYSSYMVYFDDGGAATGQWKMVRWCYRNSVTDDAVPNSYLSNWAGAPGDFFYVQGGTTATNMGWFDAQVLPLSGAWYRVETYIRPSSSNTAADGEFWVRTTRTTDNLVQIQRFTGLKTYSDTEVNRYRYIVFQNYMGNGSYDTQVKVWMDDIYVSQTQARVELCNSATWAGCTKKDIQQPVSWSNTSISVKLSKGGQSSLTGTYLYVIDSTGAVNANGYALVANTPVAPSVPTNFSVVPQ